MTFPVAERRYLTVVFIDLVGYTHLSTQLDPEDLRVVHLRYHDLALQVMERFGGFVARYVGDGILVYFGYPVAHENDAERAVRAALELVERVQDLNTDLRNTLPAPLAVRVGINSGLVLVASELLSGGVTEPSAIGDAVNLAARLQAEAPPAGVVIGKDTLELIEGTFECRALEPKPVKGLSRDVAFYHVIRAIPGATRTTRRHLRGAARMVGRQSAIARILLLWRTTIHEGRCQTVEVVGEAGIGKTRLIQEFCSRPELAGATIVQTNCHELFASTPLYPVASWLRLRAQLDVDDDVDAQLQKISTFLDELGLNSRENREMAADLLGLATINIAESDAPTPLLFKRKQFNFIATIIRQTAQVHPTLLWVEDAHWLDASSAELLHEIVGSLADARLLVILTRRSFPRGFELPEVRETVQLEQLDKISCLEIAKSIPGADTIPLDLMTRAIETSEGVPLFLQQLVISLIEQRLQHPTRSSKPDGVPLKLGEMMSERLDRRPGGRPIVQAAACIGRSFRPEFLAALLREQRAAIVERLQALVDAEILLPQRYGAEIRYEFRHALLQRIAHESMVQTERRAGHERIIDALQNTEFGPVLPEVRAHHLTEAGRVNEAIDAWLYAGIAAARRSAHVEAMEDLRRGLSLLDAVSDIQRQRQLELNLQATLMGSIMATEGATSTRVSECCQRGLELCQQVESSPLVLPFAFGQFTFTNCRGRVEEAASLARLFLSLAKRIGSDSGRVIGHRMLGMVLLGRGQVLDAKEQLERSLHLYSPERDAASTYEFGQNTQIHTKSLLSLVYFCLGDIDAALEIGIDAQQTADMLRHPHSTAIPLTYVGGNVFRYCGATEHLMRASRRLVDLAEQHRLGAFRALGTGYLGWGLCQLGHLEHGAAAIEQAVAALDSIEFRLSVSGFLAELADAHRRLGNLAAAEAACARAIEQRAESSYLWAEPELRRIEALILGKLSPKPNATEELLRRAVECAVGLESPILEYRCLTSLRQNLKAPDLEVESRLRALSHFGNLAQRVDRAMSASARLKA